MKGFTFFLLLLLPSFLTGQPSECPEYNTIIKKVEIALKAEDYKTALLKLNAAREHCPGRSAEVDKKILDVFDAIEGKRKEAERERQNATEALSRFQVSFAAYLTSEAQKAFEREDIRLAWHLTNIALQKNQKNEKACYLNKILPEYGGEYFLEGIDESIDSLTLSPDSTYFSFFTQVADSTGTLNVLELGGEKSLRSFPNSFCSYRSSHSHSYTKDSRFLVFFTQVVDGTSTLNVLELGGEKSFRSFPNCYRYRNNFFYMDSDSYNFSEDSRFLVFFTQVADSTSTLNVLELGGEKSLRSFPNCYRYSYNYRYSEDNRFLVFFTQVADSTSTLNVLELGGEKPLRSFPNCYRYSDSLNDRYSDRYSEDSRFLVFFTQVADSKGTLNVLELGEEKPLRSFTNCYHYSQSYSKDSRFLVFFTQVADSTSTLNVLELGGEKSLRSFPNSDLYSDSYSKDNRFLMFFTQVTDSTSTLNVLELEGEKSLRSFQNYYNSYNLNGRYIDSYSYSEDSRFLVFSTQVADSTNTLNVLELGGEKSLRSFPGSYIDRLNDRDSYSEDSRFLVFFTQVADSTNTLNVLELGGEKSLRSFPNSYSYRYSKDSRFLVFSTQVADSTSTLNVLELGGEKSLRSFPSSYIDRLNDRYSYSYSEDSRFLVFSTQVAGKKGTLNVLELGGEKSLRSFPNSYRYSDRLNDRYSYSYSKDSRFLVFFMQVAGSKGTLNVLELEGEKSRRSFQNYYSSYNLKGRYIDSYSYSEDSRFLSFFTRVADSEDTLKVLELGGEKSLRSFPNCYNYSLNDRYSYSYSEDSRFLSFFTQVADSKGTLNVLELGGGKSLRSFPNCYHSYSSSEDSHYSDDSRFWVFLSFDRITAKILDIQTGNIHHEIKHYYPVETLQFLNKRCLLTTTTNPVTKNKIYKLIHLDRLGEGYWEYLLNTDYFKQLTEKEKQAYGILD